jgi:hypothetical protein
VTVKKRIQLGEKEEAKKRQRRTRAKVRNRWRDAGPIRCLKPTSCKVKRRSV